MIPKTPDLYQDHFTYAVESKYKAGASTVASIKSVK